MAYQKTKEGVRKSKKESGWHVVPGIKKAAKKNRRKVSDDSIRKYGIETKEE